MIILDVDTAARLVHRLQQLRADARPRWGKMSAHQMVCHLHDTMQLAMGERTTEDASTAVSRTVFRWMALRAPLPWPKNYPTRPEFDQLARGTQPGDFGRDVLRLGDGFRRMARRPRDFDFGRHPVFGEMTEWEWMRWAYLHAEHHFRQFGI